jgi:hypothetical protein
LERSCLRLSAHLANPPNSEAVREAEISGPALLDALVTPEGTVESPQVVKGLPGGLNELARRCNPALKENQPEASVNQFEISFRLNGGLLNCPF